MKNIYISFTLFFLVCFSLKAQDTIILKDYSIAIGKVTKISEDNVEYKSIGNLDGPIYTLKYRNVAGIKYPNGHIDVFDSNSLRSYYAIKDKKKTTNNDDVNNVQKKTVVNYDEKTVGDVNNTPMKTFNYDDDVYNTQKKTEYNSNTIQTDKQEQEKLENKKKQEQLALENKKQQDLQKMQKKEMQTNSQTTTNANDCKYSVNKVDEFTKQREVRTNNQLLFKENNTAMYLTGLDNSHSSYKFEVLACNFNGVNQLLFYGICCNCSKYELFDKITLLLQNHDVITFKGELANYKVNEGCNITWQFYEVNDSTWAKLKSSPLNKVRINFSDNTVSTVEIKEKYANNIIGAINCINVLEIPKPKQEPQIIREVIEH